MNTPPRRLAGAKIICYTPIDHRHRWTQNCKHSVRSATYGTIEFGKAAALAICEYEAGDIRLFACDEDWEVVSDTVHSTVDDAKAQAEFEYDGVESTWIHSD